MDTETLAKQLEALLFYKGEPVTSTALSALLGVTVEEVQAAGVVLKKTLEGRGLTLVTEGEYLSLATASSLSDLIQQVRKEELEGPLGKAGLETLAIIIYRGPVSKSDIEYIRGVNCSSIIRSLMMRGLIERVENPSDKRSFLYRPTPELPASLGLSSTTEVPDYEAVRTRVQAIIDARPPEEAPHP